MIPLTVIIPTYRRLDAQRSFKCLPPNWQKRTVFIVDRQDAKGLEERFGDTGAEFVVHPKGIKTIAAKRAWIFSQKKWEKVIMLDDDLRMDALHGTKMLKALFGDVDNAFKLMEAKLEEYMHGGFSARRGVQTAVEKGIEWRYNFRAMYSLAYRTSIVRKHCELGRINHREDLDYTLQLLRKGFKNAVYSRLCVDEAAGYDAPGGVNAAGERSLEASNADARRLAELHPGLVDVVERTYKGSARVNKEFDRRLEVICHWKKAYNYDSKPQQGTFF